MGQLSIPKFLWSPLPRRPPAPLQGCPHDNQSWCARAQIWKGMCTLTSSNHHCPQHPRNHVMPLGTREGKVLQSTLATPQERHGCAGLSLITLPGIRRAGESAQGGSPWTGSTGCLGETGTEKGFEGEEERDCSGRRAALRRHYILSEANIKNLIRSCATVLLQSRHPFVAVPPSSYALFPGQLSLKVPPCSTSSWAFKGYFGGD